MQKTTTDGTNLSPGTWCNLITRVFQLAEIWRIFWSALHLISIVKILSVRDLLLKYFPFCSFTSFFKLFVALIVSYLFKVIIANVLRHFRWKQAVTCKKEQILNCKMSVYHTCSYHKNHRLSNYQTSSGCISLFMLMINMRNFNIFSGCW